MNGWLHINVFRIFILLVGCAAIGQLGGCASPLPYTKVNFCWTSEHRMAPTERVVRVSTEPEETARIIRNWVGTEKGTVLETTPVDWQPELAEDAAAKFTQAQVIIQAEWQAYDQNVVHADVPGEWAHFVELMNGQYRRVVGGTPNILIRARLRERPATVSSEEVVGTQQVPSFQSPGTFTSINGSPVYFSGVQTYMQVPVTKMVPKTVVFCSIMEFVVYRRDQSTYIYVKAMPMDTSANVTANYGNAIGHAWWPYVTGKEEEVLVRDYFRSLRAVGAATIPLCALPPAQGK